MARNQLEHPQYLGYGVTCFTKNKNRKDVVIGCRPFITILYPFIKMYYEPFIYELNRKLSFLVFNELLKHSQKCTKPPQTRKHCYRDIVSFVITIAKGNFASVEANYFWIFPEKFCFCRNKSFLVCAPKIVLKV